MNSSSSIGRLALATLYIFSLYTASTGYRLNSYSAKNSLTPSIDVSKHFEPAFTHKHKAQQRKRPACLHSSPNDINLSDRKTYKRFMQIELWRQPEMEGILPILISIEQACSDINRLMRRVSTDNLTGYQQGGANATNSVNVQGEDQKKLDIIANRIMKTALCCSGKVSILVSEEDDKACLCSDVTDNQAFNGEYAAVFDPLDGSSNVDSGLPTGTIFGIYRNPNYGSTDPQQVVKQKGSELVVAGYCLYSAATHIVITLRTGVHIFTLDDVEGTFYLTRSNVKIPRSGNIYSFNDANSEDWDPAIRFFINDLKNDRVPGRSNGKPSPLPPALPATPTGQAAVIPETKPRKTNAVARYMGALVADSHNLLLHGGIFGYPATAKNPKGKLRLLYEANPLALIFEEAGGMAINGKGRILDTKVDNVHQRTPLFLGSVDEIIALQKYINFGALGE
jgi:fructose-1,6-bisphosphatase I